jgi:hypothetical protein
MAQGRSSTFRGEMRGLRLWALVADLEAAGFQGIPTEQAFDLTSLLDGCSLDDALEIVARQLPQAEEWPHADSSSRPSAVGQRRYDSWATV